VPANLENFGLGEMLRCSVEVRQAARDQATMEAAARQICRYFYDGLVSTNGERACAMVRCYKTHLYGDLPTDLQRFAMRALRSNDALTSSERAFRCLTLLGSAGDETAWNDRHLSAAHQAIPLLSSQMVQRAPMIAQLIKEFGLEISEIVEPQSIMRDSEGKTYGVFHVEDALDSPYIPAQAKFVQPYNIRSVVGFGGSLTAGNLFAVILFSRVRISARVADRFRTIALDVKGSLLPFEDAEVFDARPVA